MSNECVIMTDEVVSTSKNDNYEPFSLVWFDDQANNNNNRSDYITFQEKLQQMIQCLKIFENIDQCEEYLRLTTNYDQISLIINSQFAEELIPRIHSLKQILSIYISTNKDQEINEQWINKYPKIKYFIIPSDELLTAIQSDHEKSGELFAFSIYKSATNQDDSFVFFQLLLDCLLRMENPLPDRTPLLLFCREFYKNNPIQLNIINEFEQTYSSDQALTWYQRNTCFSKLLNKALVLQNIEILFLFRFFLRDLQKQLAQNQYSSTIRLYRRELITNDELELLKNSIGGFISIHSFFSMEFAMPENSEGILFEIDLDPQFDHNKPFSMVNPSEILTMPGSIFRLIDIDKECSIIRLKLSDENFQSIFNYTKNKLGYDDQQINLITLGNLLWKMNRLDQAEKYYLTLLNFISTDQANLYYHLGHIYSDKDDYNSSLKYYQKSLDLWAKSNDSNLANNYNAIATNYWKQGDYKRAFESFQQALTIFKQIYGEDDINVAMCLNNMGTVVSNEKNYSKALVYYLQALNLFEKHLGINHPNLASLHCNISTIYKNLKQIDSALKHLNLSLNIYEKILPSNHSNIPIMLKNIAFLYEQKGDLQQALNSYKKISNIYQQTLSSTDPAVIQNEEKIQQLSSK